MIRLLTLLVLGATAAACAHPITDPATDRALLPRGLAAHLTIDPGEVQPHEPFTARLTVKNTTTRTIRVVTAHGCLAVPHVIRDGQRVPLKGSGLACYTAATTHTFAPGETRTYVWNMRAELHAQHPGEADDAPAPVGTYLVRAEFDTLVENGRKPFLEHLLYVR